MKREQPRLPVRYHHEEGEIILSGVEPGQRIPVHEELPQRSRKQRCHGTRIWKIFLPISVVLIVAGTVLAMFLFGCFEKINIPRGLNKSADVALPEVENLTVTAIADDYFTLSWKPPLGSFHSYVVQVVLENIDEINDTKPKEQTVGSCLPVNFMNEDQTSITCNNVSACSNVTVTVHTQNNETRPRKSPGVSVPVFLHGGAPDEFSIHRLYYDFTSVGILIDASNNTNGLPSLPLQI
ncbi:uncharacterized protein LOC119187912 isoform X2 [Rhipicephalus microplus]|uniref:uncharacterized protein LOC119187912 isoform X2 n=1 Tax=Rhipicephalus microplus TaxID=6941 RepID=UPI003F6D8D04